MSVKGWTAELSVCKMLQIGQVVRNDALISFQQNVRQSWGGDDPGHDHYYGTMADLESWCLAVLVVMVARGWLLHLP